MKIYIITLISIAVLASCSPDRFQINWEKNTRIFGEKLCSIDSVEAYSTNAIKLCPGGCASMKLSGLTQLYIDLSVVITEGEGVRIRFRTVSNDYKNQSSISLVLTGNGYSVEEKGKVICRSDSLKAVINQPNRIILQNDGKYVKIRVDCDDIYTGITDLPATEYLIIETMPHTTAKVFGIDFADMQVSYEFREVESKSFGKY
ncbi:MAG: hypothetical protein QG635_1085 [Bacteroidota bacterium]|nr:hypothetical protein [Bacteroidota bacterium]